MSVAAIAAEPTRGSAREWRASLGIGLVAFGLMLNAAWVGALAWLPVALLLR